MTILEKITELYEKVQKIIDGFTNGDPVKPDEEIAMLDGFYDNEFERMYKEGLLTFKELGEAKLTTKKRKSLPDSVFCGPGRSFPINDCSHAVAGMRLLGRYKGSPSTKAKIAACIRRKAKALGCPIGGKKGK